MEITVYIRGSAQWSFEPLEVRENVFITPRYAQQPSMEMGAELKAGKKLIGTVTAFGSYKGSSYMISYEPALKKAQPRRRKKKVEEEEDGISGSSGVDSSGVEE